MKILIVSATAHEIAALAGWLNRRGPNTYRHAGHDVTTLVTGVGMVATAARTVRALGESRCDLALNLGICGSFDTALPPGTVVHVTSDHLVEMGAEDGDAFLSGRELGLLRDDEPPFSGGRLVNAAPPRIGALERLPTVRGITVNTVHGNARSIDAVVRRCHPQVESMEGAAFMYACLIQDVPFAQVRGVSNVVAPRNRAAWKIDEAIAAVDRTALEILEGV
jgi:futalosine hydrolase